MSAKNQNEPVIIIGAGPAGLSAAYCLAKESIPVIVLEAEPHIGGMSRSFDIWGHTVDVGPHRFFSKDPKINQVWTELVGKDYITVQRLTRIYYNQRFFHYPIRAFNALSNLGIMEASLSVISYVKQKIIPEKNTNTFESWVVDKFGRRLFRIFFQTYSEKLWGISCADLDSDFASQRIKKFSLFEAIKNAFGGTNKHQTLVDRFDYPQGGTGDAYESAVKYIKSVGGQVRTSARVEKVIMENGKVSGVLLCSGETILANRIINTMPLTTLLQGFEDKPNHIDVAAKNLRFRNTVIVYLRIPHPNLFPDNWIYVHDPFLTTGRITNFRNWSPDLYKKSDESILALEYWCNDNDTLWNNSDEKIIQQATEELMYTDLSNGIYPTAGFVYRVPNSYPVYQTGYKQTLEPIIEWLKTIPGLQSIGRSGAFKYNNQDHSILMGMLAAENIQGAQHDTWSINTDYDTYQESAEIKS